MTTTATTITLTLDWGVVIAIIGVGMFAVRIALVARAVERRIDKLEAKVFPKSTE